MTLYSDEVKRRIRSYDWPPGNRLRLDIEDGLDAGHKPCLIIRMFRDNFITFDGVDQMRISNILNELIPALIADGTPTRLVVDKGDGQNVRE